MNRKPSFFAALLISCFASTPICALASSDLYSITVVPSMVGVSMTPEAMNNSGQVVGQTFGAGGYGTFFSNGTTTVAGPNGSQNAVGINDSSTICGYMTNAGKPYIYTQNGSSVTTIAPNTAAGTYPNAINNAGQIAGYGNDPTTGNPHALLYTSGAYKNLGVIGAETSSYAYALNNQGDVVGIAAGVGAGEPFIYTDGAMQVIGSVAGRALGINDSRQVIGDIAGGSGEGFYYDYATNSFTTIAPPAGYLGCYLDGINDAGIAVGGCSTSSANTAGIVFPGQGMADLNQFIDPSSGWRLSAAYAINTNGQILATGALNGVGQQVVILTPIPIPEPAIMSMMSLGCLGLFFRRNRCRVVR